MTSAGTSSALVAGAANPDDVPRGASTRDARNPPTRPATSVRPDGDVVRRVRGVRAGAGGDNLPHHRPARVDRDRVPPGRREAGGRRDRDPVATGNRPL